MWQDLLNIIDLQQLTTQLIEFLPRLVVAIVILVVFLIISKVTRTLLRKGLKRANFNDVLISLLVDNVYKYVVVGFGLIMALDQLGVNIAAALAGVGVVGIAIGFAAQDSFANVIAGILIFWDKPFVVGDWIETENEYGKVTNITLRTTRIRTPRNTYIVIPNKRIIDEVLENFSKHGEVRVEVSVGIAYKEDIGEARAALLDAANGMDLLLDEPAPDIVVSELGGSSVNLLVRGWIKSADDLRAAQFALVERAKKKLDSVGIEIPFPHLQLFVDNVAEPVWEQAGRFAKAG